MLRSLILASALIPLTVMAAERHVIVTPAHALTDADRTALEAEGVHLQRAVSGGRFIARVDDAAALANEPRLARIVRLTAVQKVNASAWRAAAQAKPFAGMKIFFHSDVSFADAREAILAAGGQLDDPLTLGYEPLRGLAAHIPSTALQTLAGDERVLAVYGQRHLKTHLENATAAALSHVSTVQAAPYNLSGDGIVLANFEFAPLDTAHVEFGGRATVDFTCSSSDADCKDLDNKEHITHTSGTMIASGVNPNAKGMAPKATLHEFQADKGNWLTQKDTGLSGVGATADSNSWGYTLGWVTCTPNPGGTCAANWEWITDSEDLIGGYSGDLNAVLDHVAFTSGALGIYASGNEAQIAGPTSPPYTHVHVDQDDPNFGPTSIVYCVSPNGSGTDCATPCRTGNDPWGDPYCETSLHPNHAASGDNPGGSVNWLASGKNIMAVGATSQSKEIAVFSSRGPAKDGRVKPDIVAKGQALFSSVYTGTTWDVARACTLTNIASYGCAQGTSMSTPVVTGTMAIFAEQWKKTNNGVRPLPLELKALAIAGAEDLGNPGPDYTYGFGFLNAQNSVDLIIADNGQGKRIKIANASTGSSFDYPITLTSSQDMRVVLSWFDPEVLPLGSEEVAAKTLVNDLDLKIVGPDSSTTLPYVLDVTHPGNNATRGVNNTDNTEEVEIKGAPAGTYHVIVNGTNIPQGTTQFVVISNADFTLVPQCVDATEPNDTVATAYTLPDAIDVNAEICPATDVDHFKFSATTSGSVQISIKSVDSPLKATLITNGVSGSPISIAAGSTNGFTVNAGSGTTSYVVRVEANGTLGATGAYTINARYPIATGPRHRAAKP
ncbi:MAG TPA: S8 family serine peptidase [Thermoanaerobaculia bacterium]|nr:S8 family serine peptidase [Thermoanaerobaculia bacterium]